MVTSTPLHNLDALLIGTGEFLFSSGATSVADAQRRGYVSFGNIVASTPSVEQTREEHFGSYRGIRRMDKIVVTESKLRYRIRSDEWNFYNLQLLFGGALTAGHTQPAHTGPGRVLVFNDFEPSWTNRWYDLSTAGGARLMHVTSVTFAGAVLNVDFVVDRVMGRVRFLNHPGPMINMTPLILAPAIENNLPNYYSGITPLADVRKSGFGKLAIYDQHATNKLVMLHDEFSCEITPDSAGDIDGRNYAEISLDVLVTGAVGRILLRDANKSL